MSDLEIGDLVYPFENDDPKPFGFRIYDMKAGGMGNVYFAYNVDNGVETGGKAAIKTLQDWCLEDAQIAERFYREAEVWVKLGFHRNIVRALMAIKYKSRPYIFLEFIKGHDLRAILKGGSLSVKQCVEWAKQFCKGMVHAQEKVPGFVHRDIKPENCLVDNDGVLKITDFGLVKAFDSDSLGSLAHVERSNDTTVFKTQTGQWGIGTYPYMAPEQFEEFRSADVRTDIYSFGIMFYEMLTGQRPFKGNDADDWYKLHKTEQPLIASKIRDDIPIEVSMLISMCLAKEPEKRAPNFAGLYVWLVSYEDPSRIKLAPGPPPKQSSETPNALGAKAMSLRTLGKHQEALSAINQAIELSCADWLNWHTKGLILFELNRFDESILCYERAVEFGPDRINLYIDRVKVFQRLNRFDEALDAIDLALKVFPSNSSLMVRKASIMESLGRIADSETYLLNALERDPDNLDGLFNTAVHFQKEKKFQHALKYIDRLVSLSETESRPSDYKLDEVYFLKIKSLLGIGEMHDACYWIEKAYKVNPTNLPVLYLVGMMHLYPEYGIELDRQRGLGFVREAANLGHSTSIKWLEEYERNKHN